MRGKLAKSLRKLSQTLPEVRFNRIVIEKEMVAPATIFQKLTMLNKPVEVTESVNHYRKLKKAYVRKGPLGVNEYYFSDLHRQIANKITQHEQDSNQNSEGNGERGGREETAE